MQKYSYSFQGIQFYADHNTNQRLGAFRPLRGIG